MTRRRTAWVYGVSVVTALSAVCTLAATAAAATALGPPAGWPDLAGAALAPSDFPSGAVVATQQYVKPDSSFLAEYDREFKELTVRVNAKRLLGLENDVAIAKTAAAADLLIKLIPLGLAIESDQIGKEFAKEAHLKPTYTKLGKPTSLGAGNDSVGALIRIGTKVGEIRIVIAVMRVRQVDSFFFFAGLPRAKIGIPDAKKLAALSAKRIGIGLAPHSSVAPTVTGTAEIGQTLTAQTGTWLGFATGYSFQWDRCDATASNCIPIPGATAATYVVTADDVSMTLRVDVVAQNVYGPGAPTSSPATGVVPEPPPLTP